MQFLLSKYIMPADASRHIETNWSTDSVFELFRKYDNRDPPKSATFTVNGKNRSLARTWATVFAVGERDSIEAHKRLNRS